LLFVVRFRAFGLWWLAWLLFVKQLKMKHNPFGEEKESFGGHEQLTTKNQTLGNEQLTKNNKQRKAKRSETNSYQRTTNNEKPTARKRTTNNYQLSTINYQLKSNGK